MTIALIRVYEVTFLLYFVHLSEFQFLNVGMYTLQVKLFEETIMFTSCP